MTLTSRRTKIIATVGPASRSPEVLDGLIDAGADIFRLNFSHGSELEHRRTVTLIREAATRAGVEVGILGDLPGPKIRLRELDGGRIELSAGGEVTLTEEDVLGGAALLPVALSRLGGALRPGGHVFIADGKIRLGVREVEAAGVRCEVEVGGFVGSRQGVNLPGAELSVRAGTQEDHAWIEFAVSCGVDLLAVSFVRSGEDLESVESMVRAAGADIPLIAKIEHADATERLDRIVEAASGGVMVARGDLGIELPLENVPGLQRKILSLAGQNALPSITATQMLASMVDSPRPTRAEVSDVANAIFQGTDAVMLSEETAVGGHPVEAVRVMDRIARAAEPNLTYREWARTRVRHEANDVSRSLARAAVDAAQDLEVAALVIPTASGRTARLVAAHRPGIPILAVSPRLETVRRMSLPFGVRARLTSAGSGLDELVADCARQVEAAGLGRRGDLVGIMAGVSGHDFGTNLFEVHRLA